MQSLQSQNTRSVVKFGAFVFPLFSSHRRVLWFWTIAPHVAFFSPSAMQDVILERSSERKAWFFDCAQSKISASSASCKIALGFCNASKSISCIAVSIPSISLNEAGLIANLRPIFCLVP